MQQRSSTLLINEPPLVLIPSLARKIGINGAIVLQQLHYWIVTGDKSGQIGMVVDDQRWIRNSVKEWQETNFSFMSVKTVERTLEKLRASGLVLARSDLNRAGFDRTKWYTIDYDALNLLEESNDEVPVNGDESLSPISSNWGNPFRQIDEMDSPNLTNTIPETTAKTTTKTTTPAPQKKFSNPSPNRKSATSSYESTEKQLRGYELESEYDPDSLLFTIAMRNLKVPRIKLRGKEKQLWNDLLRFARQHGLKPSWFVYVSNNAPPFKKFVEQVRDLDAYNRWLNGTDVVEDAVIEATGGEVEKGTDGIGKGTPSTDADDIAKCISEFSRITSIRSPRRGSSRRKEWASVVLSHIREFGGVERVLRLYREAYNQLEKPFVEGEITLKSPKSLTNTMRLIDGRLRARERSVNRSVGNMPEFDPEAVKAYKEAFDL